MATDPTEKQKSSISGTLVKNLVFLPFVQYPPFPRIPDLSDPSKFSTASADLSNTTNLYISSPTGSTQSSSRIGAWYLLPEKSSGKVETLTERDTIILYLHGNSFNRSQGHRVGLYSLLLHMGYYILAIDYRGFGDSSAVDLSEQSVVTDARAALGWINDKLGDKVKVLVWGHSLGSAISCHMVADFDMETGGSSTVSGVVLESPFNSMHDEIMTFKAAQCLALATDVPSLLQAEDIVFESEKWLPAIRCPVIILHAEDDNVVPHRLGQKLYEEAVAAGKNNIRFVTFPKEDKLGHNNIYLGETIKAEIKMFVEETLRHVD